MGEYITIDLFGKKLKFMADENVINAGRVADLLFQEVQKVQNMQKMTPGIDNFTQLTQAALNITNDFIALKDNYDKLLKVVMTRSNHLIKTLETCEQSR
ncbi:MAG: hypothetical protein ACLFPD_03530 [Desulfosudaceae bacterium]